MRACSTPLSIRHSHSTNEHRLAGPVGRMPDLKLPLLFHFMAASKHAEDFTRQIDQYRRENMHSII
jgi:hypothetical protein